MLSQLVYVVNQNGQKLMPCKPAKARKLLRAGRAKVTARSPFTIQLLWECEEHLQEVVLGIDKGSHVTGFACVGQGEILLSGESGTAWMSKTKWMHVGPTGETAAPANGIELLGF